jgi:hypothetical protein
LKSGAYGKYMSIFKNHVRRYDGHRRRFSTDWYSQGAKVLRNAHIIFFATLNLLIGLTVLCPRSIDAGDNSPSIRFRWSFCAQTGLEDRSEIVAITKDTPLRSGDRIKMFTRERLTALLMKPEATQSAVGLLRYVDHHLVTHIASVHQSDDITMVAIRRCDKLGTVMNKRGE